MVRPGRDRLAGTVEVDETYLGGLEEGKRGRQTEKKALIVVAAQEEGRGIGRIRMRRIADASAASLMPFVPSNRVASCIRTGGWATSPWKGRATAIGSPSFEVKRNLRPSCCRAFIASSRC